MLPKFEVMSQGQEHPELKWAKENRKAIRKHFSGLKRRTTKSSQGRALDAVFHEQHDAEFRKRDCLTCANCCRTTSPIFRDRDIDRLAKHLRMRPSDLIEAHLQLDDEGDYVLRVAPCPFLDLADNKCSVYEHRPAACREYPHTNRKNMAGILDLTERNTRVCPAVASMVRGMMGTTEPRRPG